ncbi:cell wall anchor protein [Phyllobacterium lublinensis]|uniref:cell wall anchor protein n=1 Tax=Phyllobacterium lublinensis TaxID=2875708 RepID=UPI001CCD1545|nr:cell wall anchor protein [Phyllobacterium sp. 2063]MBZ9653565.1 cell wall anchor protein [Phyllobacterium sp. 2063]
MRTLLFAVAAALALSACNTTKVDETIQKNLPRTCSLINQTHAAFVTVSISGSISVKTVAKEAAAYDSAQKVCADPSSVTASTALVKAAEVYATIAIALREAKNAK